jgi:hypothetical protein
MMRTLEVVAGSGADSGADWVEVGSVAVVGLAEAMGAAGSAAAGSAEEEDLAAEGG